jgi:hypothetical protein
MLKPNVVQKDIEKNHDLFEDKNESPLASQFPDWDLLPPIVLARRKT